MADRESILEPRTGPGKLEKTPDFPEEWISIAAYYIWKSDGQPDSQDADYWETAKAELTTRSGEKEISQQDGTARTKNVSTAERSRAIISFFALPDILLRRVDSSTPNLSPVESFLPCNYESCDASVREVLRDVNITS